MAPSVADIDQDIRPGEVKHVQGAKTSAASRLQAPLKYTKSLDDYESFNVTPVIGREFPKLQLKEILDDDTKLRDLAVLGD
jgi:hypothetical protein